uniref:Uncharacterized protein n=1 Tax=Trichuris muris TaxID=70415 RepID=A0A5S6QHS4_TRIMR
MFTKGNADVGFSQPPNPNDRTSTPSCNGLPSALAMQTNEATNSATKPAKNNFGKPEQFEGRTEERQKGKQGRLGLQDGSVCPICVAARRAWPRKCIQS